MSQTSLSPELTDSYEIAGYTDISMSKIEIIKMLDSHGVCWETCVAEGGVLYATDDDNVQVDTTNWTLFNVLSFLNY